jgi:hypothetical protein
MMKPRLSSLQSEVQNKEGRGPFGSRPVWAQLRRFRHFR